MKIFLVNKSENKKNHIQFHAYLQVLNPFYGQDRRFLLDLNVVILIQDMIDNNVNPKV